MPSWLFGVTGVDLEQVDGRTAAVAMRSTSSCGIRALMVHAIDDHAASFYRRFGFIRAPSSEQTLFLPIDAITASTHWSQPRAWSSIARGPFV
jgi:hypothetical protein